MLAWRIRAVFVGAAWLFGAAPAAAQSIALERFEPAPPGDAYFGVQDATVTGHVWPSAGATLSFADSPLVLTGTLADGRRVTRPIVAHQLVLHAAGAVTVFDRALFDLDVPMLVSQRGDSPASTTERYDSPHGTALSDVRVGARAQFLRQATWYPALAVTGRLWLPTSHGPFAGSDLARHAVGLVAGGDHGATSWRVAGSRRRGDEGSASSAAQSALVFDAGLAWRSGPVQLGSELFVATPADRRVFAPAATNAEVLWSLRFRSRALTGGFGVGPGLARAPGTPAYRLLAQVVWSPPRSAGPPSPRRGDPAASRWSPFDLEPQPVVRDGDGDGVLDADDRCPSLLGVPGGARAGCPPDGDGDGVSDGFDRCPAAPGVRAHDVDRHGCPLDGDGDGMPDARDACPTLPATTESGCPSGLRVFAGQLVVSERIAFETGSDVLAPGSSAALEPVAAYLEAHPEIARIAVDGHTDDVGNESANLELSRRRAVAVVRWLVAKGVDERRLEVRGFGPRRPLAPNDTPQGRAANRRVEFTIVATREEGERAWRDGPMSGEAAHE